MSGSKPMRSVKVTILGDEHNIRSTTTPEEARAVAEYVDSTIREIMQSGAAIETSKAVILASLRIAGELFQSRKDSIAVDQKIRNLCEDIRPWLPPAKRAD